jgi:UrcA family protein
MSPMAKNLMGAVAALALTAWQGAALSTSLSGTAGQTHSVTVHYADLDLNRAAAGSAGAERLPSPVPDRCRSEGGACLLPRVQQALTDIERAVDDVRGERQSGPVRNVDDLRRYPLLHSVSEPWTTWMFDGRADDPSAGFRGARYDDSQAVVPRAVQGHGLALARWVPPATGPSASSAAIGSFDPTGRTNSQASRPSSAGYGSKRQPFLHRPAPRSPRSYCFSGKTIQAIFAPKQGVFWTNNNSAQSVDSPELCQPGSQGMAQQGIAGLPLLRRRQGA